MELRDTLTCQLRSTMNSNHQISRQTLQSMIDTFINIKMLHQGQSILFKKAKLQQLPVIALQSREVESRRGVNHAFLSYANLQPNV